MNGIDDIIFSKVYTTIMSRAENKAESEIAMTKEIYASNSRSVIFILPQWRSKSLFYFKPLINKLKSKHRVVIYQLPFALLSADVKLTAKLFKDAARDINETFELLRKEGCEYYSIIGNSTSCVIAAMAANQDNRCKKLILNLVGNDLAECMWYSQNPLVKNIKNILMEQGISLNKLKNHFEPMSYSHNSNNLKKKNILVFLSKNDRIVPYKSGIKFLGLLRKDRIKYKLVENIFLGHYFSYIKNVVLSNKMANFLDMQ